MKKFILILFVIFSLIEIYSAKPAWVTSFGIDTKYENKKYLTGFGIAPEQGKSMENYESAKTLALRDIASAIKTKIVSKMEIEEKEKNDEYSSMAKVNIQTSVYLDISGIDKFEEYYDKKDNLYYALCVINKKTFLSNLAGERKKLLEDYKSSINSSALYLKKKNQSKAKEEYEKSLALLERINQNYLISNYLKEGNENFNDLYKLFELKNSVYGELIISEITSFNDLSKLILNSFKDIDLKNKTYAFIPAYYKTTKISSEFFYYLKQFCIVELGKAGARPGEITSEENLPDYIFKGSFFNTTSGYKVLYSLTDTASNLIIGIAEVDIPEKFIKSSGLSILPDNIDVAVEDNKAFAEGQLDHNGIHIKAWTNKGSEDVVFKQGDDVEFYIQSNKSGYISIIYHLAGSTRVRTPLVHNFYIPQDMVFKKIKITDSFEVYPPFGSETAQVFFSTVPLKEFDTKIQKIDSEEYEILNSDFKNFLKDMRGLKTKKKGVETAEAFITITTIP